MVLEYWCIASVSFQVFCDLWNECWQFGVTRGALCILRSTCSATSAILIHSELHFGQWRGRSGRVSVLHDVCMSRVRWIALLRGAFAWTSSVSAGRHWELSVWGNGVSMYGEGFCFFPGFLRSVERVLAIRVIWGPSARVFRKIEVLSCSNVSGGSVWVCLCR